MAPDLFGIGIMGICYQNENGVEGVSQGSGRVKILAGTHSSPSGSSLKATCPAPQNLGLQTSVLPSACGSLLQTLSPVRSRQTLQQQCKGPGARRSLVNSWIQNEALLASGRGQKRCRGTGSGYGNRGGTLWGEAGACLDPYGGHMEKTRG